MWAQNFNYLRKISIDPWCEIERPAMKYGRKKEDSNGLLGCGGEKLESGKNLYRDDINFSQRAPALMYTGIPRSGFNG